MNFTNYTRYKWFFTSSGKLVIGGKNAVQNDELLKIMKEQGKDLIVMHTSSPGSPFSIILDEKASKEDIEECAVFTACFSQAWKSGKKTADVDIFNLSQLGKPNKAKTGTWQVFGEVSHVRVSLELVLTKQMGILRAVPEKSSKKPLLKIAPGKTNKEKIIPLLEKELKMKLNKDEVLSALPAGGINITI